VPVGAVLIGPALGRAAPYCRAVPSRPAAAQ